MNFVEGHHEADHEYYRKQGKKLLHISSCLRVFFIDRARASSTCVSQAIASISSCSPECRVPSERLPSDMFFKPNSASSKRSFTPILRNSLERLAETIGSVI